MLRVPQHERKNINDIDSPPFVLSAVEGLIGFFQHLLGAFVSISKFLRLTGNGLLEYVFTINAFVR